jgi:hypothetical protein
MLLDFISLKMGAHWRSSPIGKVRNNLSFFKKLADENFIQNLTALFSIITFFNKGSSYQTTVKCAKESLLRGSGARKNP